LEREETMKPGYGLELVQTQKLSLTPEIRQAIMVLQMNTLELVSFIREQVEENPLLELDEEPHEEALLESPDASDEEWLAYFCDSSDLGTGLSERPGRSLLYTYDALAERRVTLKDDLLSQLGLMSLTPAQCELCEFIIGNLDDNGYLCCSPAEMALATGNPKPAVEEMLRTVQSLDPPGIAARDLRECLTIQARAMGLGPLPAGIIDNHLEDLASGRYRKIAREQRVPVRSVLEARDVVLRLDPKPGARFSGEAATYVYPEVVVRKAAGQPAVSFNENALPRIRWNSFYRRLIGTGEPEARSYLLEQLRKARAFLRSIEQRKQTMLRVMECVSARQSGFFAEGPGHIEPLTMKDVAEELGVHESTVSRCVSNKYVDTPYGIYPCRMFFSPGVRGDERNVSQDSVKKVIQELIVSEDPRNPLVDQEISTELLRRGVHVARRTVSKYRSLLGIQPSNRRKAL